MEHKTRSFLLALCKSMVISSKGAPSRQTAFALCSHPCARSCPPLSISPYHPSSYLFSLSIPSAFLKKHILNYQLSVIRPQLPDQPLLVLRPLRSLQKTLLSHQPGTASHLVPSCWSPFCLPSTVHYLLHCLAPHRGREVWNLRTSESRKQETKDQGWA